MRDDNMYLLVKDDCDGDGESVVVYEKFGTKHELRKTMRDEFKLSIEDEEWDQAYLEDDRAGMWIDDTTYGERSISWWMVPVKGRYVVILGNALDGGGIEVKQVGSYETFPEASEALDRQYEHELACPRFYAGWDSEYCSKDEWSAALSVETFDAATYINVLCTDMKEPYLGWNYLG